MTETLILQLPSPPYKNVFREWSGGMGTALDTQRSTMGHDHGFYDVPFSVYLYVARRLEQLGVGFAYADLQARTAISEAEFDDLVAGHAPRVLITQVNLPSLAHDSELIARVRRRCPAIKVVLVGATAKWFKARLLQTHVADVVMEEAEELLVAENVAALLEDRDADLQACSVLERGLVVSRPTRTPMKSLDFVDFPAYELLDFARYQSDYYGGTKLRYATVFTSKGCPYTCGYCPYPYGFGSRLIYRSPQRVVDDIERLQREFGVAQVLFRDQVFTLNPKHARKICEELVRRNLGIVWVCETRYDVVDLELLELMKHAGCIEVHFGLESADPEMFAKVAKSDGPKSLDLFEQVIGWARGLGLRVHVHLIVGMPDESSGSILNTTRWLRRVRPHSVQLAYFVPYPGTPLFDELRQSRELGDVEAIDWERMGAFSAPVLPTRHLNVEQVRKARERLAVDWQYTFGDRVMNRLRRLVGVSSA